MKKTIGLIASTALFSTLYRENKNIYDVLAEITIFALIKAKKTTFTLEDLREILADEFSFNIPGPVVRKTLKKLRKRDKLSENNSIYSLNNSDIDVKNIEELKSQKNEIIDVFINNLTRFLNKKLNRQYKEEDVKNIIFSYIAKNNNISREEIEAISEFILTAEENPEFRKLLSDIKEGYVIYEGLVFNYDDIDKKWEPLTIYLDMEYLFHAFNYNGEVFKKIFYDFFDLVKEVNKKRKIIYLKYFPETKDEIDNFFNAAEDMKRNHKAPDPSKTAMVKILEKCEKTDDIIKEKNLFLGYLRGLGILLDDKTIFDYENDKEYNLEDKLTIDNIKKFHDKDDTKTSKLFTMLSKINKLRYGNSNGNLRNIKYVLATGKNYLNKFSYRLMDDGRKSFPLSTTVEILTERIWLRLNMGLQGNTTFKIPISFDAVIKAKLSLTSLLAENIHEKYQDLVNEYKRGETNEEVLGSTYIELREKALKPEEITKDNIHELHDFMKSGIIEIANTKRKEAEYIKYQNKELTRKLRETEYKNKKLRHSKIINSIKWKHTCIDRIALFFLSTFLMAVLIGAWFFSENDSITTKVLAIVTVLTTFGGYIVWLHKWINYKIQVLKFTIIRNELRNNKDKYQ